MFSYVWLWCVCGGYMCFYICVWWACGDGCGGGGVCVCVRVIRARGGDY